MNEEWRPVAEYTGLYEVSSIGRVRSLDRVVRNRYGWAKKRGKVRTPCPDRAGYQCVSVSRDNIVDTRKIHRLVAYAFLGDPPDGSTDVNHKDFNKANNRVENLEWCSRGDNLSHALDGKRFDASVSSARAKKLTAEMVIEMRRAHAEDGVGCRILGKRFDIAPATAQKIINREVWKHV